MRLYERIGDKMQEFDNKEEEYLQWIDTHPNGFVINLEKSNNNPVLHKADCGDIAGAHPNYTTEGYKKICSMNERELKEWCIKEAGNYHKCQHCYSPHREYD